MSKLKISLFVAIFGLFLFSCSDDDDNSTITNPTQEVPQVLSTNLVTNTTSTFDGKNAVKVELTSAYQTEINNSGTGAGNGPSYAIVGKDFQNGTIEVEIAAAPNTLGSPTSRGFAGLAFHIDENSKDYEAVYFRIKEDKNPSLFSRRCAPSAYTAKDLRKFAFVFGLCLGS